MATATPLPGVDDDIEIAVAAELCRRRLYYFLREFWGVIEDAEFQDNWHIEFLCNEFQAVAERVFAGLPREDDLLVNIPYGTSKSTIGSVMLPAWCWCRMPSCRLLTGSYSASLATKFAQKSRDILKSDRFRRLFPGLINFRRDLDLKYSYANDAGGERRIVSTGATATGFHGHLIILDDPLNREDQNSEAEMQNANDWMDKTMSTRKIDKAVTATITIMQRLGEADPSGHLLEKKKEEGKRLRHICLPGELKNYDNVNPPELRAFYKGDLLDPVRLDWGVLRDARIDLGSIEYDGQIGQSPSNLEGGLYKRSYWRWYGELSKSGRVRRIQSWDTAFKKEEQNSKNACWTIDEYPDGYYLVDLWFEHADSPEVRDQIRWQAEEYRPDYILIEEKASGITIIQDLKLEAQRRTRPTQRLILNIIPIPVEKDKILRAMSAIPTIEAGNVYLPKGAPWARELVNNAAKFPKAKYMDDIDALNQGIIWLKTKPSGTPTARSSSSHRQTSTMFRGY